MSNFKATQFQGTRVTIDSDRAFDDVMNALLDDIGREPLPLADIAASANTWKEYERAMAVHLGPSGFMLFSLIDHGAWIGKAGIGRKAVRVVLGNPMIAITLIRHDLSAGLFAPVELIVYENGDGLSTIVYLKPSSLLVAPSAALKEAAVVLDEKLATLISKISDVQHIGGASPRHTTL